MRPELLPIWQAYASQAADHVSWSAGAAYLRESTREQADGFSLSAQLKGTLDEARKTDPKATLDNLPAAQKTVLTSSINGDRRTLVADSFIPVTMALIYLCLLLYFKFIGGYKVVHIAKPEEMAAGVGATVK